jgi:hypothetical protein
MAAAGIKSSIELGLLAVRSESDLATLLGTTAVSLMQYVAYPEQLGPDFARGHMSLAGKPDLDLCDFTAVSESHMGPGRAFLDDLCSSTGIINIGVCGSSIYVRHKWLVGPRGMRF